MKIHKKKFTTLSIGTLWTLTLVLISPCGYCSENSNTKSGEFSVAKATLESQMSVRSFVRSLPIAKIMPISSLSTIKHNGH